MQPRFQTRANSSTANVICGSTTRPSVSHALLGLVLLSALAACDGSGGGGTGEPDNAGVNQALPGYVPPVNFEEPGSSSPPVGDTSPRTAAYRYTNNAGLLTGPVFGSGRHANAELVRPVEFTTRNSDYGLQLSSLVSMRHLYGNPEKAELVGVIRNTSSELMCQVEIWRAEGFDRDGAGIELARGNSSELHGAPGILSGSWGSGHVPPSCLPAGDSAYVSMVSGAPLGSLTTVSVDGPEGNTGNYSLLSGSVLPVSYSIGTTGIDVRLVNTGPVELVVKQVDGWALDEAGHPLAHDYNYDTELLAPGQEYVVEGLFRLFTGQASTAQIVVDFTTAE